MRITNKIMQNNSLANINKNKLLQDKLNTQMTSQSKIVRPSDDPVVAIRALRLRSNLSEVTQYYEKNIPDAKSWLSLTEDALNNASEAVTEMYDKFEAAANGSLKSSDRAVLIENLKALREEFYATGDSSCAGKQLFTGYRTDSRLSFIANEKLPYDISEKGTKSAIEKITSINTGSLEDSTQNTTTSDITSSEVYRIRLSYQGIDTSAEGLSNLSIKIPNGTDQDGNTVYDVITPTVLTDGTNPYEAVKDPANAGKVFLNPETGELLLGDEVVEKIQALGDTETIEYSYRKSDWQKGDLRPEHYFECTSYTEVNGTAKAIEYNKGKDISDQEITYDIGFNQKLKVNTLASDVFTHDLGRDIDEIIKANQDVIDMEEMIVKLESELKNASEDDKATVQARLDAANKACDLLKDKCQKAFESGITKMQKHLDKVTLAITSVGNTGNRLDMVENRLQAQQTNFKQLASDNEGVDLTELAVQLSSAELSFEAALLATGKITQNSLMNFI